MRHTFDLVYDLNCTVGEAVAAYLDAEHYMWLHASYMPQYEVLEQRGFSLKIRQSWSGLFRVGNTCWTEYEPPATFLNYYIEPVPSWLPSVHHLVRTATRLTYLPSDLPGCTESRLHVDLDMPWFLWPLRHMIERRLCRLKVEKDQEDVDMIHRYQQVHGRGNLKPYFAPHVFMLHKDAFVSAFSIADKRSGNGARNTPAS